MSAGAPVLREKSSSRVPHLGEIDCGILLKVPVPRNHATAAA